MFAVRRACPYLAIITHNNYTLPSSQKQHGIFAFSMKRAGIYCAKCPLFRKTAGRNSIGYFCGGEGGDLVGGPLLGDAVEIFGVDPALEPSVELDPVPDGAPADLLGRPAPEDAR
jgi:hypothetical protein